MEFAVLRNTFLKLNTFIITYSIPGVIFKSQPVLRIVHKQFQSDFSAECWPGRSVGIVTGYGQDGPGIQSRWRLRFSAPVQTGPGAHPASYTMVTGSFPGVKNGRGVTLTPRPLLVPWSWKGRAIPLLPLWAVRPVQSLSACTRVTFTFTLSPQSEIYCLLSQFKVSQFFPEFIQ